MKHTRKKSTSRPEGFSVIEILVALVVVATLAFGGWYLWHRNHRPKPAASATNATSQTSSNSSTSKANDPSEAGKYLVIKEWGVRVALPTDEQGDVTYSLGDVAADPDGNNLQAAKLLIKTSLLGENACTSTSTSIGDAVNTGAQYIRSEAIKPFDATRYRWTFKENILQTNSYHYHLNYVTPDCLGGGANDAKIVELQTALPHLTSVQ